MVVGQLELRPDKFSTQTCNQSMDACGPVVAVKLISRCWPRLFISHIFASHISQLQEGLFVRNACFITNVLDVNDGIYIWRGNWRTQIKDVHKCFKRILIFGNHFPISFIKFSIYLSCFVLPFLPSLIIHIRILLLIVAYILAAKIGKYSDIWWATEVPNWRHSLFNKSKQVFRQNCW